MIDIKKIIEELEFKEINELLNEFENESEKIEFEKVLEAYKYSILSDKEKQKEVKKEIIEYLDKNPILSNKSQDFALKFPLLNNGQLDNLKNFYKEDKTINSDLSLKKIDDRIENFSLKDKEEIFLELKNIKQEEDKKQEIKFDSEYSLLPNSLKVSLVSLAELNTKAILGHRVFYTIKFKKNLDFEDYYKILREINDYRDDEILKTVKNLCKEENVKTYKDIKRYGIRDLADVLKFPHYKRDEENKLYQDYLHKKPEVGRNFVTYLDEMYNIGVEYYKKEHSRVGFEKLEDIPENLKKSDNEVLALKNTILRGIKDTDLINITTNIVLSKEKIRNVFKKNNEDNSLLIDKFIEENTKDIEVLEEEKSELIKNKIYFSEIDRVYKSKTKKRK